MRRRHDAHDDGPAVNGQFLAVLVTLGAMAVSMIGAPYPAEQRLQHAPTLVMLLGLLPVARRRLLSPGALACVLGFWALHILGARWIYSAVPYDAWTQELFGRTLSDVMGWERNHYDRLVHLMFGVLSVPPAVEVLMRGRRRTMFEAVLIAVLLVMAVGSAYEILEWQLARALSPAHAEAYNGQQGDLWDPQKDMALATLGAVVMATTYLRRHRLEPTGEFQDGRGVFSGDEH